MMDKEIAHKIVKSKRYAGQRGLFKLKNIEVEMKSKHGQRKITFSQEDHIWKCTCEFYYERGTCSHIMALQRKLGNDLCNIIDVHIEEELNDT